MKIPSPCAPDAFRNLLVESLTDSENPAYGQIATVDLAGVPQVRTVHLRYVPEKETLGFAANRRSRKWGEITGNRVLSGCWFDRIRMVQFRWESEAEPVTGPVPDRMWGQLRSTVRILYWHDHLGIPVHRDLPAGIDPGDMCPSFGAVLCAPIRWDFYELPAEDYRSHRRSFHEWKAGHWESAYVAVLTGAPL